MYTNYMEPLELAIIQATEAHAGQRDPDGSLHIAHSLAVMFLVQKEAFEKCPEGVSVEELLCACVLHDCVEDTHMTLDHIRSTFGEVVARIVDSVTKRPGENYRDAIYRAKADPAGRLVKIADNLHNRGRNHTIPAKKASWAKKLAYKYDVARAVLNDGSEPTWEGASYKVQYENGAPHFFIADPNGKEIEITEEAAKNVKISFRISN
jgi:(p)ppGpp synthase/HD superfamily hydrolase